MNTREWAQKDDLIALEAEIEGIYFDNRKGKTLHQEKIGERLYSRTISENLYFWSKNEIFWHIPISSWLGKHISE